MIFYPAALACASCAAFGCIGLFKWALDARQPALSRRLRNVVSPALTEPATLSRAAIAQVRAQLGRLLQRFGSDRDLSRRLHRAGSSLSPDGYRILLVAGALIGGLTCVWLASLSGRVTTAPVVILGLTLGVGIGLLLVDRILTMAIRRRESRMAAEFPAVAELLAFAVAAGESTPGALARVVDCSSGHLAAELADLLAEVRAGLPLLTALGNLADRIEVAQIQRFVDGVVVALDRGTPLAEVLRGQAADARAHGHRLLIEAAGRREVFMLMPVVFLILPTVVVVALFPGLRALTLTVP